MIVIEMLYMMESETSRLFGTYHTGIWIEIKSYNQRKDWVSYHRSNCGAPRTGPLLRLLFLFLTRNLTSNSILNVYSLPSFFFCLSPPAYSFFFDLISSPPFTSVDCLLTKREKLKSESRGSWQCRARSMMVGKGRSSPQSRSHSEVTDEIGD